MKITAYIIYCLTSPSGKKYVGQTERPWKIRWAEHQKDGIRGCRVLQGALRKYGAHAFRYTVLEIASTRQKANEAEKKWIVSLGCRVPDGYNWSAGGAGAWTLEGRLEHKEANAWHRRSAMHKAATLAAIRSANEARRVDKEGRRLPCHMCGALATVLSSEAVLFNRQKRAYCDLHKKRTAGLPPAGCAICGKSTRQSPGGRRSYCIEHRGRHAQHRVLPDQIKKLLENARLDRTRTTKAEKLRRLRSALEGRKAYCDTLAAKRAPCAVCGEPSTRESDRGLRRGKQKNAYCNTHSKPCQHTVSSPAKIEALARAREKIAERVAIKRAVQEKKVGDAGAIEVDLQERGP